MTSASGERRSLEFRDSGLIWDKRARAADGIMDNPGSTRGRARRYRIGEWHEWFQSEQRTLHLVA
jgi:hypothetical protein